MWRMKNGRITLPFRKVKNDGRLPQYYVENSNPPIVSRETFHAAQNLLHSRQTEKCKRKMYPLSGKLTGMSIGTSSLVIAVVMIIFAFFYDRKQINVGTVLYQLIYSFFVDVFTKVQHYTDIKALNFILMLLGVVIFAFGTGLYSAADFGRGSYEAVTFSLSEKNGWKVKIVRIVLDVLMVVIGVLLGGKFGLCTVLTVIISGPVIQLTVNTAKKTKLFKTIL